MTRCQVDRTGAVIIHFNEISNVWTGKMEPRAGFGPATYGFLSLIPSRRNDQAMLSRLSEEPGRDFRGVMYLFEGIFLIFRLYS